jgi:hypothetical protein
MPMTTFKDVEKINKDARFGIVMWENVNGTKHYKTFYYGEDKINIDEQREQMKKLLKTLYQNSILSDNDNIKVKSAYVMEAKSINWSKKEELIVKDVEIDFDDKLI